MLTTVNYCVAGTVGGVMVRACSFVSRITDWMTEWVRVSWTELPLEIFLIGH